MSTENSHRETLHNLLGQVKQIRNTCLTKFKEFEVPLIKQQTIQLFYLATNFGIKNMVLLYYRWFCAKTNITTTVLKVVSIVTTLLAG